MNNIPERVGQKTPRRAATERPACAQRWQAHLCGVGGDTDQPPEQGRAYLASKLECGDVVGEALGSDVRDATALGVVPAALWRFGEWVR